MTTKREYRIDFTKAGLNNILRRKNPDNMLKDAKRNGLKKTLTAVSSELNRNRETVKSAILDYLYGDESAIKEFKTILKDNQKTAPKIVFNDSMPEEEKEK